MTRTICLVWSGSYSDKDVVAAFQDRAPADQLAAVLEDGGVTEITLDQYTSELDRGLRPWSVTLWGEETSAHPIDGEIDDDPAVYGLNSFDDYWTIRVWAVDAAHAVKIASDKRAETLARSGR